MSALGVCSLETKPKGTSKPKVLSAPLVARLFSKTVRGAVITRPGVCMACATRSSPGGERGEEVLEEEALSCLFVILRISPCMGCHLYHVKKNIGPAVYILPWVLYVHRC